MNKNELIDKVNEIRSYNTNVVKNVIKHLDELILNIMDDMTLEEWNVVDSNLDYLKVRVEDMDDALIYLTNHILRRD